MRNPEPSPGLEPAVPAAASHDDAAAEAASSAGVRVQNPVTRHINDLLFNLRSSPEDSGTSFHIITFPPKLESHYQQSHQRRMLPIFRFALLAAAFFLMAYMLWDWFIGGQYASKTLPVRIIAASAMLVIWALTFHISMQRRIAWLMYAATVVGVLALSVILVLLPNGYIYGFCGLFFFMLASIAIAPNFRVVLWGSLLLIVIPNLVMFYGLLLDDSTSNFLIINANAFIIPLCLLACLLSFLTDQNYRRTFELEQSLQRLATTDTLTGIHNRRSLLERAEIEMNRARRHGHTLCLLLLDIDRFKPVNDTYGHLAGDEVIKIVTTTARSTLRETDVFGRMGGEEFAALLPETECHGAIELAERVRRALERARVPVDGVILNITVSIGVTCFQSEDIGVSSMLRRADDAMYQAKAAGRNRVMMSVQD